MLVKTGFQFMANKQLRMEKKDWEHQCALISHTMLLKTNKLKILYEKNHATPFF